jgi:ribulose-phosphate 3-epimerase
MTSDREIIPAILAQNSGELIRDISLIEREVPRVHIDVLETDVWENIHMNFEAHLMVDKPEHIIERWIDRGAGRIIVHSLPKKVLDLRHYLEIGLGVEFHIPISEIRGNINKVDFIQLMAIAKIGKQGNKFESGIFGRIKEVKEKFPEAIISIDGGVNLDNADDLFSAGADRLVVGSAILRSEQPIETFEKFLDIAK